MTCCAAGITWWNKRVRPGSSEVVDALGVGANGPNQEMSDP
jgi:hypothetical protein